MSLLDTELSELVTGGPGPVSTGRMGVADPKSFRTHRAGPAQPANELPTTEDDNVRGLGGFTRLPVVTLRGCAPRKAARFVRPQGHYERVTAGCRCWHATSAAGKFVHGRTAPGVGRKELEDKYHYRFWGQGGTLDGLQRNMAKARRCGCTIRPTASQVRRRWPSAPNRDGAQRRAAARRRLTARIVAPSG